MTRDEKIAKLSHAIMDLRGKYDERTGKWFKPPQPHKIQAVVRWANRLKLNVTETIEKVESFKHVNEFTAWIKSI
jgi:hypothetical protein